MTEKTGTMRGTPEKRTGISRRVTLCGILSVAVLLLGAVCSQAALAFRPVPGLSRQKSVSPGGARVSRKLDMRTQNKLSASTQWQKFKQSTPGSWQVVWNESTRTAHKVWGGPLQLIDPRMLEAQGKRTEETLEQVTRSFIDSNPELFGPPSKQLRLVRGEKHGRIWYVLYQQYHGDLLIHNSKVQFQIAENGNLACFGSDAYPRVSIPDEPTMPKGDAVKIARKDAGFVLATDSSTPPEMLVYPITLKSTVLFRPAWRLKLRTHSPHAQWVYFIDAVTGKILERYNEIRYATIAGTISGDIHPAYEGDAEVSQPFPDENVRVGYGVVYQFTLDSDPGWTTEGSWQFGQPQGLGGDWLWGLCPDPTTGHTGTNVYGYNLAGNYSQTLLSTEYLTTTAIDCSSTTGTHLRFWRWLGVESFFSSAATVEVSSNGTDWQTVWGAQGPTTNDGTWILRTYDIADVADGQSTVYVRWSMGPVLVFDPIYPARCGWNIDDMEIYGLTGSGGSATTDGVGAYSVTVPAGTYSFDSGLSGTYAAVTSESDSDPSYQTTAAADSMVNVAWNDTNSLPSERNLYYHTQVVHDFITILDPSFTDLDYSMPVTVEMGGMWAANAYWDGVGMNFGAGQPGYYGNFGLFADIVYHEYGHGITQEVYDPLVPPGAMHEGFSDYTACTITGEPELGENGLVVGESYMRTLDNALRTPEDLTGEEHDDGRIIGGALWDLRQSLGAAVADDLWHFARYGGGTTFEDYLTDVLVQDDDDGNLSNGTPHFIEIHTAFGNNHGIGFGYGLFIEDIDLDDSAGNGDGVIDAGETISLTITLEAHNVSTTSISATLSTTSPHATVTQGYSTYPDAAMDATTVCNDDYTFTASGAVTTVESVLFELAITANGGAVTVPEKLRLTIVGDVPMLTMGSSADGVISTDYEADWYRFQATEGQVITADIDADVNGSWLDSYLYLYDSDGTTLLTYNDDANFFTSLDSTIAAFPIPHDGWYFLVVEDYGWFGGPEYFYTISLEEPPTPKATIDVSSLAFAPAASGTDTKRVRITNVGSMRVRVIACDRSTDSPGWVSPDRLASQWAPVIVDPPTDSPDEVPGLSMIQAYKTTTSAEVKMIFEVSIENEIIAGYLGLDLDQNPLTGLPPFIGTFDQDVGCELDLMISSYLGSADVVATPAGSEQKVFSTIATVSGNTLQFSMPLATMADDGNMNIAASVFDLDLTEFDYAPDVGHGTIGTHADDAPALQIEPGYLEIAPGTHAMIDVTADATELTAAENSGTVLLYTNVMGKPRVEIPTTIDEQTDSDADGLPDAWEMDQFGDLDEIADGDPDGDGLTNGEEYAAGTDPELEDSDGDGLSDGDEWRDLTDYYEGIQNPFDPNDPDSTGNSGSTEPNSVLDGQDDFDGDGISNAEEFEQGTNPILQVPAWSLVGIIAAVTAIVVVGYLVTRRRRYKS